jgi:hypothetical protein
MFTYVTMVGQWRNPDGSPATGFVTASPQVPLVNGGVAIDGPVRVSFNPVTNGAVSFSLAATTDIGTAPAGVDYDIFVYIGGMMAEKYTTAIPSTVGQLDITSDLPWTGSVAGPVQPIHSIDTASLQNGWVSMPSYPGPYYLQGDEGVMHLGGTITGGLSGVVAWNMPVGMRPVTNDIVLIAPCFDGAIGNLLIKVDGDVVPQTASSYRLDGLSYIPGV